MGENDVSYDPNWSPNLGVDDRPIDPEMAKLLRQQTIVLDGENALGNIGPQGDTGLTSLDLSNTENSSNFLSRLFGGNMTSGDKAGTMLGLGALAIAQSLANKPPTIKQPVYKQAPVYNRALTAPMYGLGYLDQRTGKQVGMGMPLFFNPNPFQFDPTEAAKRYGPSPEEIAAGQQVYMQKMSDLYTPRMVPDVQMTGSPLTSTTQSATQQTTTQPATQQAAITVPASSSTGKVDKTIPITGGSLIDPGEHTGGASYQTLLQGTGMAGGGFLKGRGDGMSDEIKATINEKQPARLSDGEFVIPADVVAHLGNGSSKAGAQKLYDMMARVRKARTGKTEQAPEINPNKFL